MIPKNWTEVNETTTQLLDIWLESLQEMNVANVLEWDVIEFTPFEILIKLKFDVYQYVSSGKLPEEADLLVLNMYKFYWTYRNMTYGVGRRLELFDELDLTVMKGSHPTKYDYFKLTCKLPKQMESANLAMTMESIGSTASQGITFMVIMPYIL